ncbi:MAG TPA: polysaccharide biosynthesis tyrosine autokinase [Puia sp.]|uniref:exopolysaccharide transport family protein n=1 Tax=Puia sp. TaxID=2045100 RepID=UPI002C6143A5|nr:polysaccharide biosynthesis tyrosine autokinase [Puia sp.]HVU98922.1 polysaccharide biosynthesis tyrosine autokinase [Puia sp.]
MLEQTDGNGSPGLLMRQKGAVTIRDFVLRYLKYLPLVILVVTLFVVMAYLKIRYSSPSYLVQASLLVNNERNETSDQDKNGKMGQLFMFAPTVNLANEIEILKSHSIIQRVVHDLHLQTLYYNKGNIRSTMIYGDCPITLNILYNGDSARGINLIVNVLNDKQFLLNGGKTTYQFGQPFTYGSARCIIDRNTTVLLQEYPTRDFIVTWQPAFDAASDIISSMKVTQLNEMATILSFSMVTENISLGRNVLNTLMAVYDSTIVEDKNRVSVITLRFIDDRLEALKNDLGRVERGMSDMMGQNMTLDLKDLSKAYQGDLSDQLNKEAELQVQIEVNKWLIDYMKNTDHEYSLVPNNLGTQEPSLLQLIIQYNQLQLQREAALKSTPAKNPMIVTMEVSLAHLRRDIIQTLENVRQAYTIAANSLEARQRQQMSQLQSLPAKSMKSVDIERQQKVLEDLYSFLLQKKLETSISSASSISNIKVLETAVGNEKPISPNNKSIYGSYISLGIFLVAIIIAIFEMFNDKVNTKSELEKAVSAPILGEVSHSEDSNTLVVTANSRRFIAEQFRIIRTNLQYVLNKSDKSVIMITSSFSGEGKSFISTNIGAVMALSGKRTVVMEFDIRKPKILSALDLKRKMGITNYIIGMADLNEMLVPVEGFDNFFVIPCGPIPPNPAELLLDPRLSELMRAVKQEFDVVILDTAPIGLVSDAVHLGQYADCTLYIVRRGYTPRKLLAMIDDLYREKRIPRISLLLNDVKVKTGYFGGYYDGYGYGYGSYGYGLDSGYFEREPNGKRVSVFKKLHKGIRNIFPNS